MGGGVKRNPGGGPAGGAVALAACGADDAVADGIIGAAGTAVAVGRVAGAPPVTCADPSGTEAVPDAGLLVPGAPAAGGAGNRRGAFACSKGAAAHVPTQCSSGGAAAIPAADEAPIKAATARYEQTDLTFTVKAP